MSGETSGALEVGRAVIEVGTGVSVEYAITEEQDEANIQAQLNAEALALTNWLKQREAALKAIVDRLPIGTVTERHEFYATGERVTVEQHGSDGEQSWTSSFESQIGRLAVTVRETTKWTDATRAELERALRSL